MYDLIIITLLLVIITLKLIINLITDLICIVFTQLAPQFQFVFVIVNFISMFELF